MPIPLAPLRGVYEQSGPFATVCIDVSRDSEEAQRAIELRWREVRDDLAAQGADAKSLSALESVIGTADGTAGPQSEFAVAAGGSVLAHEELPTRSGQPVNEWAPLPHFMPLLRGMPPRVPHLVIEAHRDRADIAVWTQEGESSEHKVRGEAWPITKVSVGGWSQRRYQNSAENVWEHNAAQVAEQAASLARTHGAVLIAVTGDVRAKAALRKHLSEPWTERLVDIDDVPGPREQRMERVLAEIVARRDNDAISTLQQESGRGGLAVTGIGPVIEATRRGEVETLVLTEPPPDAPLWTGPDPMAVAADRGELIGLGVSDPVADSADAALVRTLAATDASVVLAGSAQVSHGIGAVLRFSARP